MKKLLLVLAFVVTAQLSSTEIARIKPLFDFPVRDTCVCLGPDGCYYLTGTTGYPTWWQTNEGIRVWKSRDLKTWEPLGLVWSFEKNATWQKGRTGEDGKLARAIWAPEIHYFKGTFWLAYCVNYGGTGVLRSATGKAEGPYEDMKPDGPLTGEIDASLFVDDDGRVYFVFQNGKIAPFKDDMSGLAGPPRLLKPANAKQVGFEGAFLTKFAGRYYLICADFNGSGKNLTYDCMAASADKLDGPWSERYLAIRHGGHNMLFRERPAGGGARSLATMQPQRSANGRRSCRSAWTSQDGFDRSESPCNAGSLFLLYSFIPTQQSDSRT